MTSWNATLERVTHEQVAWERPPNDEEVSQQVRRTLKTWLAAGILHLMAAGFMATGEEELQYFALATVVAHAALAFVALIMIRPLSRAWLGRAAARRWARLTRVHPATLTLDTTASPATLTAEAQPNGRESDRVYLPLDASAPLTRTDTLWTHTRADTQPCGCCVHHDESLLGFVVYRDAPRASTVASQGCGSRNTQP